MITKRWIEKTIYTKYKILNEIKGGLTQHEQGENKPLPPLKYEIYITWLAPLNLGN